MSLENLENLDEAAQVQIIANAAHGTDHNKSYLWGK